MSFFRYPGGKNKLKEKIIQKLFQINNSPNIKTYREPFWGGGSVGISLLSDCFIEINEIWINDKDIGIVSLWTALLKYPEELQKLIKKFKPSVNHFYEFKNINIFWYNYSTVKK